MTETLKKHMETVLQNYANAKTENEKTIYAMENSGLQIAVMEMKKYYEPLLKEVYNQALIDAANSCEVYFENGVAGENKITKKSILKLLKKQQ